MRCLPLFLIALVCSAFATAAPPPEPPHVRAELVAETTALLRGGDSTVALVLTPEPGWHTYWLNPGDSGLATKLEWTLPAGVQAGPIQFPAPEVTTLGTLTNYGYGQETLHFVSLTVPADWPLNQSIPLHAKAKWLACKDICIPGSAELDLRLPVANSVTLDESQSARFERDRALLPQPLPPDAAAHFAIADGAVSLSLDSTSLPAQAAVQFFPSAGDLVNHAAPQRLARDSHGWRLTQALSPYFVQSPTTVAGLWVLTTGKGVRSAYTLAATPAPVVPVPERTASPTITPPLAAPTGAAISLPLALGLALLGGLILNLMPCVFPVLSLKALALLQSQSVEAREQRRQALAYTAGTVLSCVAAASLLLALRAGGAALGWGFQLQSPAFVGGLAYLMLAVGLSMSGVAEFGTGWMGAGDRLTRRPGLAGSFFTGVLAVVVASPCTAPFMAGALGYAVTQPAAIALLVFAALGLGLALPFLLLGFVPALARRLPRPGAWMLTFKQVMAFPLYLTAAWLLWVLARQAGPDALGAVLAGCVAVALALWLYGRPGRGRLSTALAALSLLAALGVLTSPLLRGDSLTTAAEQAGPHHEDHEAWSEARVAALRAEHKTVFVNFTADWCLTCKVNERGALRSDAVAKAFAQQGVIWLTGDWTRSDPAITRALAQFGRNGVPLYLVYPQGGEPRVLPQVLTPDLVIEALKS